MIRNEIFPLEEARKLHLVVGCNRTGERRRTALQRNGTDVKGSVQAVVSSAKHTRESVELVS